MLFALPSRIVRDMLLTNSPYVWGSWDARFGLDCIGYANFIRETLTDTKFCKEDLDWIYEAYPDESEAPLGLVRTVADAVSVPSVANRDLDLFLLEDRVSKRITVSTLVTDQGEKKLFFMGEEKPVCVPLKVASRVLTIVSVVRPIHLIY